MQAQKKYINPETSIFALSAKEHLMFPIGNSKDPLQPGQQG